jgi:hypothetical protein
MQFWRLGPLQAAEQNMAAALGGVERRSLPAILLGAIGTRLAATPPAPTVLVPEDPGTRFRWSLTEAGP